MRPLETKASYWNCVQAYFASLETEAARFGWLAVNMEVERRPVVIVGPREVEPKRTTSFSIESILEKKEDKDEYKITPSAFRHCRAFQREPSLKCYNSALEYQEASQTCPSSPTCSYPCCTAFPSSSYGLCLQRDAYYRVHGALSRSLSSTMSYGASNFDPLSTYRFSGRGITLFF